MMSHFVCISTILAVALLSMLGAPVLAQNQTPTLPVNCSNAQGIAINITQFSGAWYEVARRPAPQAIENCIELDFGVLPDNTTISINVTYSNTPKTLWKNNTISATVAPGNVTSDFGFNISFSLGSTSMPPAVYKLLATDYTNYALMCAYTNPLDNATAFGFVLTRQRMLNATQLNYYEQLGAANFTNFNGTMTAITQTKSCTNTGAATQVPFMAAILASVYALLKFAH